MGSITINLSHLNSGSKCLRELREFRTGVSLWINRSAAWQYSPPDPLADLGGLYPGATHKRLTGIWEEGVLHIVLRDEPVAAYRW